MLVAVGSIVAVGSSVGDGASVGRLVRVDVGQAVSVAVAGNVGVTVTVAGVGPEHRPTEQQENKSAIPNRMIVTLIAGPAVSTAPHARENYLNF